MDCKADKRKGKSDTRQNKKIDTFFQVISILKYVCKMVSKIVLTTCGESKDWERNMVTVSICIMSWE